VAILRLKYADFATFLRENGNTNLATRIGNRISPFSSSFPGSSTRQFLHANRSILPEMRLSLRFPSGDCVLNQTSGGIRLDSLISRKRTRVTCNEQISTKPVLLKFSLHVKKLTKWLFTGNYYFTETANWLLPRNDLYNAKSTIVLQFDCYLKFPKWRLILVLV